MVGLLQKFWKQLCAKWLNYYLSCKELLFNMLLSRALHPSSKKLALALARNFTYNISTEEWIKDWAKCLPTLLPTTHNMNVQIEPDNQRDCTPHGVILKTSHQVLFGLSQGNVPGMPYSLGHLWFHFYRKPQHWMEPLLMLFWQIPLGGDEFWVEPHHPCLAPATTPRIGSVIKVLKIYLFVW